MYTIFFGKPQATFMEKRYTQLAYIGKSPNQLHRTLNGRGVRTVNLLLKSNSGCKIKKYFKYLRSISEINKV